MNPGQLFAAFAVAFCLCVVFPSAIEVWVLQSGVRIFGPIAVAAVICIFPAQRLEHWQEISFESDEEPEIMTLDLSIRGSVFSSVLRTDPGTDER
jgi:hypothetical protein